MIPVTAWTRKVKQPRGGYLPVKSMKRMEFNDGRELNPDENLNPGTIGTAVDYLSRVLSGQDAHDVFALPLSGADAVDKASVANGHLANIIMFADDGDICPELIHAGVNLSRFDVACKTNNAHYLDALRGDVYLDSFTEENIEIMLRRILEFRKRHDMLSARSKILQYKSFRGLTGYDALSGEADIVAQNAIWDCKAMSAKLRATYTAQLLAYYVMLFHVNGADLISSIQSGRFNPNECCESDFTLGFFNPRENAEYVILASELNPGVFESISRDMIDVEYMY